MQRELKTVSQSPVNQSTLPVTLSLIKERHQHEMYINVLAILDVKNELCSPYEESFKEVEKAFAEEKYSDAYSELSLIVVQFQSIFGEMPSLSDAAAIFIYYHTFLGRASHLLKNYETAIEHYSRALTLAEYKDYSFNKEWVNCINHLFYIAHLDSGNYSEAQRYFIKNKPRLMQLSSHNASQIEAYLASKLASAQKKSVEEKKSTEASERRKKEQSETKDTKKEKEHKLPLSSELSKAVVASLQPLGLFSSETKHSESLAKQKKMIPINIKNVSKDNINIVTEWVKPVDSHLQSYQIITEEIAKLLKENQVKSAYNSINFTLDDFSKNVVNAKPMTLKFACAHIMLLYYQALIIKRLNKETALDNFYEITDSCYQQVNSYIKVFNLPKEWYTFNTMNRITLHLELNMVDKAIELFKEIQADMNGNEVNAINMKFPPGRQLTFHPPVITAAKRV